jgi:hypothetical protein
VIVDSSTVFSKASVIRAEKLTPSLVTPLTKGGTPMAMLSTAHHQSFAAVSMANFREKVELPAALLRGDDHMFIDERSIRMEVRAGGIGVEIQDFSLRPIRSLEVNHPHSGD